MHARCQMRELPSRADHTQAYVLLKFVGLKQMELDGACLRLEVRYGREVDQRRINQRSGLGACPGPNVSGASQKV